MKTDDEREDLRLIALERKSEQEGGGHDLENYLLDGISSLQALQSSWMCLDMVERHLLDNKAIILEPRLHKLADQASEKLFELYTLISDELAAQVPDAF